MASSRNFWLTHHSILKTEYSDWWHVSTWQRCRIACESDQAVPFGLPFFTQFRCVFQESVFLKIGNVGPHGRVLFEAHTDEISVISILFRRFINHLLKIFISQRLDALMLHAQIALGQRKTCHAYRPNVGLFIILASIFVDLGSCI